MNRWIAVVIQQSGVERVPICYKRVAGRDTNKSSSGGLLCTTHVCYDDDTTCYDLFDNAFAELSISAKLTLLTNARLASTGVEVWRMLSRAWIIQ